MTNPTLVGSQHFGGGSGFLCLAESAKPGRLVPKKHFQHEDGCRLNVDQLKAYTGDFRSPKLATTWKISVQDDQLLAKHKLQKSVRLFFTGADRFTGDQWWFQEIIFDRDNKGQIIGFRLTAEDGLVRKLAFNKQLE